MFEDIGTNTQESYVDNLFTVFPNPTQGFINIYNANGLPCDVKIFDLQGNLLYQRYSVKNETALDISNFAQGVYLLKMFSETNSYTELIERL